MEEACAKWCQRVFLIMTFVPMLLSLLEGTVDWVARPAMKIVEQDLTGQVYVMTGGADGIGKRLAVELEKSNVKTLVVGVRNSSQADTLKAAIVEKAKKWNSAESVIVLPLNLSSFQSVRAFAHHALAAGNGTIDAVINVAGTAAEACKKTEDGNEVVMQVNFLSPFLLTKLLTPALRRSHVGGRVVHVSCESAFKGVVKDFEDLDGDNGSGDGGQEGYSLWEFLSRRVGIGGGDGGKCVPLQQLRNSKLLLTASAMRLSDREQSMRILKAGRRRKDRRSRRDSLPVTADVVDPGSVQTEFWKKADLPSMRRRRSFNPVARIFGYIFGWIPAILPSTKRTAIRGAHAVYHVATSPHFRSLEHEGGLYFSDKAGPFHKCGREPRECGSRRPPRLARSRSFRDQVWKQAAGLTAQWAQKLSKDDVLPPLAMEKAGDTSDIIADNENKEMEAHGSEHLSGVTSSGSGDNFMDDDDDDDDDEEDDEDEEEEEEEEDEDDDDDDGEWTITSA